MNISYPCLYLLRLLCQEFRVPAVICTCIVLTLAGCGGLAQLMNMQVELQNKMTVMVQVPVVKEGKRLEGTLIHPAVLWFLLYY